MTKEPAGMLNQVSCLQQELHLGFLDHGNGKTSSLLRTMKVRNMTRKIGFKSHRYTGEGGKETSRNCSIRGANVTKEK